MVCPIEWRMVGVMSTHDLSPSPRQFYLDFETTGLSPATAQVMELALRGAARLDRLVSDAPPASPEAFQVHGISPWLCQCEGRPSRLVLAELLTTLGSDPVEIIAHNARFERGFLEAWAEREDMRLPDILWTCTLEASRRLMTRAPINHQLGSLATSLGWRAEGLHRSAADTEITVRLHQALEAWGQLKIALGPDPGVVYLAGPLRGDGSPEAISHNQGSMKVLARWTQAVLPTATLVVPHLNFEFVDESGEQGLTVRAQVLRSCEQLVARSNAIILFGPSTEGMQRERLVADGMGIPVFSVPGWDGPTAEKHQVQANEALPAWMVKAMTPTLAGTPAR